MKLLMQTVKYLSFNFKTSLICCISIFLSIYQTKAQGGLEDQYQFNFLTVNPAIAGIRGNFGFTAQLGNQFNGTIAPNQVSQIFALDGKIGEGNGALGFQGFRINQVGVSNAGLNLNYAHTVIGEDWKLNIGTDVGVFILPNFITNIEILDRFNVYAGLGFLFLKENWFIGLSNPSIYRNKKGSFFANAPSYISGGYTFGYEESLQFNLSTLISLASNTAFGNQYHLTGKIWLGNKIGLGLSARQRSGTQNLAANFKIIPMVEYKVSSSSRVGLSYDSQPLSGISGGNNFANPNGVFQLLYRYDLTQDGQKAPSLNFY